MQRSRRSASLIDMLPAPALPTKSCLPQAMEQIAYADRIILNKTDLVRCFTLFMLAASMGV